MSLIAFVFITTHNWSFVQGNVFTGVCLSTGGSLYNVTSCLAAWSHVFSGGSLSLVPCSFQGVSVQEGLCPMGISVKGSLCRRGLCLGGLCPWGLCSGALCAEGISRENPPPNQKSRWYTSYWNAFFFLITIFRRQFPIVSFSAFVTKFLVITHFVAGEMTSTVQVISRQSDKERWLQGLPSTWPHRTIDININGSAPVFFKVHLHKLHSPKQSSFWR